ncbi:MAG TPA: hypothetical protein VNZ26_01835 [Vicinamibacterales bacterium]|nr:hypothetical protein [Vicinamibacterales bacterium]
MKEHRRLLKVRWMLPVVAILFVAGHVFAVTAGRAFQDRLRAYDGLAAAVASAVIVLVLVKHLGLLAMLLASLHIRRRRNPDDGR